MIKREDMLELTRRMTAARTHFSRIAGAYIDEEGFVDGTFNTNFLKLKGEERQRCFDIAKSIPFAKTNEELKDYKTPALKPGSIWQLLQAIKESELKNDELLLVLYEVIAERYPTGKPYAIYVYFGTFDIPVKGADKERLDESVEVYKYMLFAIAPTDDDYTPQMPDVGFLYPALVDRSSDTTRVNVYQREGYTEYSLAELLELNK